MSKNVAPRKTEYKGIVFDSKSEAVFARALDLADQDWIYHPLTHCGHEWDFLLFPLHLKNVFQGLQIGGKTFLSSRSLYRPYSKPMLIEYKPSAPTRTYIDNLTNQMRQDPVESVVVWGNPWDGCVEKFPECCYYVYPIFSSFGKYGWGDFNQDGDNGWAFPISMHHPTYQVIGIEEEHAQEAKNYRFDLQ